MADNDRAAAYGRRLDEHLATFATNADRQHFLAADLRRWEEFYHDMQRRAARNRGAPEDGTATDYLLTILEISKRLYRLRGVA